MGGNLVYESSEFVPIWYKGVLDNAGFPAVVTAHFVPVEGQQRPRTTILIKFAEEVSILPPPPPKNQTLLFFSD